MVVYVGECAYPVKGGGKARASLKVIPVLVKPRELGLLEQAEDARALSLVGWEASQIRRQRNLQPPQERRDRNIGGGELANSEALGREERLDGLSSLHELLGVAVVDEHGELGGVELVGDSVDEEAGLGAENGVFREDAGLGEEVCDEFDENKGLVQLDGLGRGLVSRDLGTTERDGRDLWSVEQWLVWRVSEVVPMHAPCRQG